MEVTIINKKEAKGSTCSPTLKVFCSGFCKNMPTSDSSHVVLVKPAFILRTYE